jgi:hypothetical protein
LLLSGFGPVEEAGFKIKFIRDSRSLIFQLIVFRHLDFGFFAKRLLPYVCINSPYSGVSKMNS